MTTETTSPPGTTSSGPQRRRRDFGQHVAGTVANLQKRLLDRDSAAVALMARLRASAGKEPGADYTVLDVTRVPDRFFARPPGDAPTEYERAKHTALTLYAGHQQSVGDAMHAEGIGFGAAVSRLSRDADSPAAVRRRFSALGPAMTYDAVVYHVRGLISLLKQRRIALDYGLLADDLYALQRPEGSDRVRALWGRDFYRTFTPAITDNPKE